MSSLTPSEARKKKKQIEVFDKSWYADPSTSEIRHQEFSKFQKFIDLDDFFGANSAGTDTHDYATMDTTFDLGIIDDIFKANITTKEESKGSGIGLYMSQLIAQKNGAQISVENINGGAKFTILFT